MRQEEDVLGSLNITGPNPLLVMHRHLATHPPLECLSVSMSPCPSPTFVPEIVQVTAGQVSSQ